MGPRLGTTVIDTNIFAIDLRYQGDKILLIYIFTQRYFLESITRAKLRGME